MRQNGHGAITIEDVRTWIEETGLCIFLPRSAQAGFTAPTFVEAVAGERTTEPTLELIASAEELLVRLEAEGVAVRLNLSGQPGDQPDYVVAGWVLPYIYALRGDRDWRRSPQLTGSRQVSQLAVLAAKQIDSANMTAAQIRDALGREVTETAVLRALHELWKQLRIIPVVPEVGVPALWQPLRQRFQKAIAEGASTSQVTAISVLASIYLQAVIAASMEDVEMFLSPLTARSKIREVVRGLAATRQVHSTTMGTSPMFYVAGTLPEFPAVPTFQISAAYPPYRNSNYRSSGNRSTNHRGSAYPASYLDETHDEELPVSLAANSDEVHVELTATAMISAEPDSFELADPSAPRKIFARPAVAAGAVANGRPAAKSAAPPRPRPTRSGSSVHPRDPRDRNRNGSSSAESRPTAGGDRRRAPQPRTGQARPSQPRNGSNGARSEIGTTAGSGNGSARPVRRPRSAADGPGREPAATSASKRFSFSGQGKSAPKNGSNGSNGAAPGAPQRSSNGSRPSDANRRG